MTDSNFYKYNPNTKSYVSITKYINCYTNSDVTRGYDLNNFLNTSYNKISNVNEVPNNASGYYYNGNDIKDYAIAYWIDSNSGKNIFDKSNTNLIPLWCTKIRAVLIGGGGGGGVGESGQYVPATTDYTYKYNWNSIHTTDLNIDIDVVPGHFDTVDIIGVPGTHSHTGGSVHLHGQYKYSSPDPTMQFFMGFLSGASLGTGAWGDIQEQNNQHPAYYDFNNKQSGNGGTGGSYVYISDTPIQDYFSAYVGNGGGSSTNGGTTSLIIGSRTITANGGTAGANGGGISNVNIQGGKSDFYNYTSSNDNYGKGGNGGAAGNAPSGTTDTNQHNGSSGNSGNNGYFRIYFLTD